MKSSKKIIIVNFLCFLFFVSLTLSLSFAYDPLSEDKYKEMPTGSGSTFLSPQESVTMPGAPWWEDMSYQEMADYLESLSVEEAAEALKELAEAKLKTAAKVLKLMDPVDVAGMLLAKDGNNDWIISHQLRIDILYRLIRLSKTKGADVLEQILSQDIEEGILMITDKTSLLTKLGDRRAAEILDGLAPAEAAEIINALSAKNASKILLKMDSTGITNILLAKDANGVWIISHDSRINLLYRIEKLSTSKGAAVLEQILASPDRQEGIDMIKSKPKLLTKLGDSKAAEILGKLTHAQAAEIINELSAKNAIAILLKMDSTGITNILLAKDANGVWIISHESRINLLYRIEKLSTSKGAAVLEQILASPDRQEGIDMITDKTSLLTKLGDRRAAEILDGLAPAEAAEIINALSAKNASKILLNMVSTDIAAILLETEITRDARTSILKKLTKLSQNTGYEVLKEILTKNEQEAIEMIKEDTKILLKLGISNAANILKSVSDVEVQAEIIKALGDRQDTARILAQFTSVGAWKQLGKDKLFFYLDFLSENDKWDVVNEAVNQGLLTEPPGGWADIDAAWTDLKTAITDTNLDDFKGKVLEPLINTETISNPFHGELVDILLAKDSDDKYILSCDLRINLILRLSRRIASYKAGEVLEEILFNRGNDAHKEGIKMIKQEPCILMEMGIDNVVDIFQELSIAERADILAALNLSDGEDILEALLKEGYIEDVVKILSQMSVGSESITVDQFLDPKAVNLLRRLSAANLSTIIAACINDNGSGNLGGDFELVAMSALIDKESSKKAAVILDKIEDKTGGNSYSSFLINLADPAKNGDLALGKFVSLLKIKSSVGNYILDQNTTGMFFYFLAYNYSGKDDKKAVENMVTMLTGMDDAERAAQILDTAITLTQEGITFRDDFGLQVVDPLSLFIAHVAQAFDKLTDQEGGGIFAHLSDSGDIIVTLAQITTAGGLRCFLTKGVFTPVQETAIKKAIETVTGQTYATLAEAIAAITDENFDDVKTELAKISDIDTVEVTFPGKHAAQILAAQLPANSGTYVLSFEKSMRILFNTGDPDKANTILTALETIDSDRAASFQEYYTPVSEIEDLIRQGRITDAADKLEEIAATGGLEKAAVVLALLKTDSAAKILQELYDQEQVTPEGQVALAGDIFFLLNDTFLELTTAHMAKIVEEMVVREASAWHAEAITAILSTADIEGDGWSSFTKSVLFCYLDANLSENDKWDVVNEAVNQGLLTEPPGGWADIDAAWTDLKTAITDTNLDDFKNDVLTPLITAETISNPFIETDDLVGIFASISLTKAGPLLDAMCTTNEGKTLVREILLESTAARAAKLVERMTPATAADIICYTPADQLDKIAAIFKEMDPDDAAEVLTEMLVIEEAAPPTPPTITASDIFVQLISEAKKAADIIASENMSYEHAAILLASVDITGLITGLNKDDLFSYLNLLSENDKWDVVNEAVNQGLLTEPPGGWADIDAAWADLKAAIDDTNLDAFKTIIINLTNNDEIADVSVDACVAMFKHIIDVVIDIGGGQHRTKVYAILDQMGDGTLDGAINDANAILIHAGLQAEWEVNSVLVQYFDFNKVGIDIAGLNKDDLFSYLNLLSENDKWDVVNEAVNQGLLTEPPGGWADIDAAWADLKAAIDDTNLDAFKTIVSDLTNNDEIADVFYDYGDGKFDEKDIQAIQNFVTTIDADGNGDLVVTTDDYDLLSDENKALFDKYFTKMDLNGDGDVDSDSAPTSDKSLLESILNYLDLMPAERDLLSTRVSLGFAGVILRAVRLWTGG